MNRVTGKGLAALALLSSVLGSASAQGLASPFGSVSQKIDSTTITIEYYRPSARGRAIFGRLVKWGEVWTPGANWATTIEVNRDIRFEGQPLPRGKYSVWMIPAMKPDSWTVVLSREARRFHVMRPGKADDELRIRVSADSASHLEMVTFSFPSVTRTGATLAFQWAETVVPMRLEIVSSRSPIATAHPASSYAGTYEFRWEGEPAMPPVRYEVIERRNGVWVRTAPDAVEPGLDTEFDLMPAGGDTFHPRQYKNTKHIGDEMDELIVFHIEGERATGFELRGIAEGKVLGRATRVIR